MKKSWRKKCRNTYRRNLGFGALLPFIIFLPFIFGCNSEKISFEPATDDTIVFLGNTFSEGFQRHNYFETFLYHNFPDKNLIVRNISWSADEVDLMPRPLNFPSLEEHLMKLKADVIFLSFGLNESYQGERGVDDFKTNLEAFISNLRTQNFNGKFAPRLILLSPIAYERLNGDLPEADMINSNLELYTNAMHDVAQKVEVDFVDLYHPVNKSMAQSTTPLTSNGIHLNDRGRIKVAELLAHTLNFPTDVWQNTPEMNGLRKIIDEKNKHFFYTYRPSNSEYLIGRRKDWPGGQSLHMELESTGQIVNRLDSLIWEYSESALPGTFQKLADIIRYGEGRPETLADRSEYLPDKSQFILKEGYEIELFASEQEFPIGNPVTMTFDPRGRLWLSTMPSYPNYYPGDPPNDQIIILEDEDQDGKADRHIVFADSLYLPLGFELDGRGVFLTQAPDFIYLEDTTGDDVADTRDFILHGFGTEDAHHSLSAYTWGPDGALYMHMGTFLHSQVETPYGPRRGAYGTTWRYDPKRGKLDNYISYPYANPWGNVFNAYGDHLIADASTGRCHFGTPLSTHIDYPIKHTSQAGFLTARFAPKTCGIEIISSDNFPEDVQGDILLNTFVGF
ncbi:MAG TPA: PVC-type heme-binding CxxCH protein, partial [Membranihabitans sp.]|nr:PVC-type heme-binding CxxCH protein [Membranihabitans sp.]